MSFVVQGWRVWMARLDGFLRMGLQITDNAFERRLARVYSPNESVRTILVYTALSLSVWSNTDFRIVVLCVQ